MQALELKVYELFKTRFSEEEATMIVEYIEAKTEKKCEEKKDVLATKSDINDVRLEIRETKVDIIKWLIGTGIAIVSIIIAAVKLL